MNTTDIQQRILERFAEPSEFEGRFGRIVVWYDAPGEFEDVLPELDLSSLEPPVELVVERPNELFELKRLLNGNLAGRRILLYRKRRRGEIKGDWLADVIVYAEAFEANRAALVQADINAADTSDVALAVEEYLPFLSKKANLKRIKELRTSYRSAEELHLAVMACALGKGVAPERVPVIARYLERCWAEGAGGPEADLAKAGCWDAFAALLRGTLDYSGDASDAEALVRHVLLTAFVASAGAAKLGGLAGASYTTAGSCPQMCQRLVLAWYRDGDRAGLYDACRAVERVCNIPAALEHCTLAELASMDVLPCVNERVLHLLMTRGEGDAASGEEALAAARQRKGLMWYEPFARYFEAVDCSVQMRAFRRAHEDGFHRADVREVWEGYTGSWCAMDTLYRRFCTARLHAATESPVEVLDDDLRTLAAAVERLYKGWFVPALDEAWLSVAGDDLREAGYARDHRIARQIDFFMTEGSKFKDGKHRLVVVVSDALRYEVALELAERIEQRTKGTCERASMQAVFPSVTSFGMAALLPHRQVQIGLAPDGGGLEVLVDGMPTRTTGQRQEVLRAAVPTGRALRYDEVADMGKAQLKALLDEAGVVYIYHNAIDATGDKPESEKRVFDACADAVGELSSLVERLAGVLRMKDEIVVTADHGFLYTYEPLEPAETVGMGVVEGEPVCAGRHHAVARSGATSDVLVGVALAYAGAEGLAGFAPRATVRLSQPGAGQNYVHGGVSLQELCVPLLRYRKPAGSEALEAATPGLEVVGSLRTITSSFFSVRLLQVEPVGGKVVPGAYEAMMVDEAGTPVSAPVPVAADLADADRAARQITVRLTLGAPPGGSWDSTAAYHLVVRDAATGREVLREPYRIQIAFAEDDFGF